MPRRRHDEPASGWQRAGVLARIKDVGNKHQDFDGTQNQEFSAEISTRLRQLRLRESLRGKRPYGAPQIKAPIRLNVNENTHPAPQEVSQAIGARINQAIAGINRYPDRDFIVLRRKLASYLNEGTPELGVPLTADNIWAANGSNEVLQHIFQAFGGQGRTALSFTPTYSMYELIAAGTDTLYVTAARNDDHRLILETAKRSIKRHQPDVLILCSPNNPVGDSLDVGMVKEIYDYAAPYGTFVVIDEAYAEFMQNPANSALRLLTGGLGRPCTHLAVIRTMSKAFGAAGLRVGYLAAAPEVVLALQLVRLPYHLSAVTQAAAEVALDHADILMKDVEKIKRQRDRIVEQLTGYGYEPYPSDANFVLFGGVKDPAEMWRHLLGDGILIRDVNLKNSLRVTAGTQEETSAFLKSAAEYAGIAAPSGLE